MTAKRKKGEYEMVFMAKWNDVTLEGAAAIEEFLKDGLERGQAVQSPAKTDIVVKRMPPKTSAGPQTK